MFGTGKFPIGISETKIPEGELSHAHLENVNPNPSIETSIPDDIGNRIDDPYDVGYEGDGRVLGPGSTFMNRLRIKLL